MPFRMQKQEVVESGSNFTYNLSICLEFDYLMDSLTISRLDRYAHYEFEGHLSCY